MRSRHSGLRTYFNRCNLAPPIEEAHVSVQEHIPVHLFRQPTGCHRAHVFPLRVNELVCQVLPEGYWKRPCSLSKIDCTQLPGEKWQGWSRREVVLLAFAFQSVPTSSPIWNGRPSASRSLRPRWSSLTCIDPKALPAGSSSSQTSVGSAAAQVLAAPPPGVARLSSRGAKRQTTGLCPI